VSTQNGMSGNKPNFAMTVQCDECPWRTDVPVGRFGPGRFAAMTTTVEQGWNPMFACHKSTEQQPATCVGYLLVEGETNWTVRLAIITRRFDPAQLRARGPLFGSFVEMARANGLAIGGQDSREPSPAVSGLAVVRPGSPRPPKMPPMPECAHPPDSIAWADREDRPMMGKAKRKCFRCGHAFPIGRANDDENSVWEVLAAEVAAEFVSEGDWTTLLSRGEAAAFRAGFYDSESPSAKRHRRAYEAGALARSIKWSASGGEG
jgi:hypothetical protein